MRNDIIQAALAEIGNREIVGPDANPAVMKYYHDIGHRWVLDDEVAWCAAFVNWVLWSCDYPNTKKLNARSFLNYGEETIDPQIGDIVVLWRIKEDSPYGHVGFFIRELHGYIYILGGNQSNEVSISAYPKSRLLSYRKIPEK